jgi:histidyl-tRNA synthetase
MSVTDRSMTIEPKKISGFTELLPEERIAELSLIDAIRRTYELSGFSPIETPAVERLEVLVSK